MNVDPHYQRQKCRPMTLVSGNINCFRYSKAFLAGMSSNLSGVVEIDEFAMFLLPYLRITAALIGHYDNTPLWIPVGSNKDNLE